MAGRYHAVQGDAWDHIALITMGDERYMEELVKANYRHRQKITMDGGEILAIPDVEEEEGDIWD